MSHKPSGRKNYTRPHIMPPRDTQLETLDAWVAVVRTHESLDEEAWADIKQHAQDLADLARARRLGDKETGVWLKPNDERTHL